MGETLCQGLRCTSGGMTPRASCLRDTEELWGGLSHPYLAPLLLLTEGTGLGGGLLFLSSRSRVENQGSPDLCEALQRVSTCCLLLYTHTAPDLHASAGGLCDFAVRKREAFRTAGAWNSGYGSLPRSAVCGPVWSWGGPAVTTLFCGSLGAVSGQPREPVHAPSADRWCARWFWPAVGHRKRSQHG